MKRASARSRKRGRQPEKRGHLLLQLQSFDQALGTARRAEHRPEVGALHRHAADGAVEQHVHRAASRSCPGASRSRSAPGHHWWGRSGWRPPGPPRSRVGSGVDLDLLAGEAVEIGHVVGDGEAGELGAQGVLVGRRERLAQRGPIDVSRMASRSNALVTTGASAAYRCGERRGLAAFHRLDQARSRACDGRRGIGIGGPVTVRMSATAPRASGSGADHCRVTSLMFRVGPSPR